MPGPGSPVTWLLLPEPMAPLPEHSGPLCLPWAWPFPGPGSFLRRRYRASERGWPGWTVLEGASRLWAGRSTSRQFAAKFSLRELCARLARPPREVELMAPSLAALELFARHRGKKTLLLDLPLLRSLHEDLDTAARAHPNSRFLQRHRATARWLVRQERELVLADEVLVRGHHAAEILQARGIACRVVPEPDCGFPLPRSLAGGDLLLAGLATSRNGILELLQLLERHPEWRLRVRAGEGVEPAGLLQHPQVTPACGFDGVSVVVAPSWVECYPREIGVASQLGIPVVATRRSAGAHRVREVARGDVAALETALLEALSLARRRQAK